MLKLFFLFISALACTINLASSSSFDVESFIMKNHQKKEQSNKILLEIPDCIPNSEEGNEGGRCVKRSQCQNSTTAQTPSPTPDPATLFDSRENDGEEEDEDLHVIDPEKNCTAFMVCCPLSKIVKEETVEQPRPIGCGYSNPGGVGFREGDSKAGYAEYAEFPWMVALMLNKESKTKEEFKKLYLGGGTIIHPSVVLTVAHKLITVTRPKQLKCRAGQLNWSEANEIYKTQEREVSKTIVHPEFNQVHIRFDIALLILSSPFDVTSTPNIAVACLEPDLPASGSECYSMGWGKDLVTGESNAATLKKITLPLVGRQKCQTEIRKNLHEFTVHHTFICAGGEANVDTCFGDGGSSLVCPIHDVDHTRYSVVGMVGYGDGCGQANVPGVYTNVPLMYDWVVNKMAFEKFNSSSFKY